MARRFDRSAQFSVSDRLPYIADTNDLPVELAGLDVRVLVTGLFAETTQTLTVYNPNSRDLEGNLVLPLPDGAAVCGYAIDVDGQLVDGVVVPKEEARRILDAEIRKGVDPGLVEQVQGNVYRTRIYPLPARGTRTIRISYISRLSADGNDAAYHLPLGHAEGVDSVSLRVEVSQTPVQPALVGGLGNLTLNQFESRWVAEAKLGEGMPTEDLQIRLPNLPDHVTSVENFDGQDFFCISSRTRNSDDAPWAPARVAVLWDASGSRGDVDRELALLGALAQRWQRVTFDVRVLRDVLDPEPRSFAIADGDAAELIEFLRGLAYDGATNLAAVDLGALPHEQDEAWLLFTDGLNTIGAGIPAGPSPRVFAISAQAKSDSALLGLLASRSGGAHINLLRTGPDKAAQIIASWHDMLRLERAADCEDVHVYSADGRLTVVGRLTAEYGSVYLTGPGAPNDQLSIAKSAATSGRNLARAWAGQQAQLETLLGSDPEVVVDLGRRFGLVTPGTSLLVLETLDQYLEYGIEPPATLPAMRAQFLDRRTRVQKADEDRKATQLESVHALWTNRIRWWERDFSGWENRVRGERAKSALGVSLSEDADFDRGDLRAARAAPAPSRSMSFDAPPSAAAAPPMDDDMDYMDADYIAAEEEMHFGEGGAPAAEVEEFDKETMEGAAHASIQIQPWSPDTPYLTEMKAAGPGSAYDAYLRSRPDYAASPAFFLDCADHLLNNQQRTLGLRVLSNLLELALDDPPLLRMYAWRMQQAGELDQAIEVLERVLAKRDDEPQSHRDLALALEQRWQRDADPADAQRAMSLLWAVVTRSWDRFPEIEIIALMELNRLIHLAASAQIAPLPEIDSRFIKMLDLDVRISMSWDADLTDVDLHVFEPSGEHAYYGHNTTEIGGLVSRDFREGYGPEEYVLRRAPAGDYTIKTHYYGSHQQTISGACTVIVTVFTNYGRANEQKQILTVRLQEASDQVLVGKIAIGASSARASADWEPKFRSLDRGMTLDQIIAVVGQPNELRGSDETVLVYFPAPGVEVHITTAPRLKSVRRLMDGASLDLI